MKFCDVCDVVITQGYFQCILCRNVAHDYCALRTGLVNKYSQFYCYDHQNFYVDGKRTRHEVHMARSVIPHENEEDWGQEESESEVQEEEEIPQKSRELPPSILIKMFLLLTLLTYLMKLTTLRKKNSQECKIIARAHVRFLALI